MLRYQIHTTSKRCAKCGLEKAVSEFQPRKSRGKGKVAYQGGSGYVSYCKTCVNETRIIKRQANLEESRTYERIRTSEYNKANPDVIKNIRLKGNFGVNLEWYNNKLLEQNGRCSICGALEPDSKTRGAFCIDHDHACCNGRKSCGKCIRDLLCNTCNAGLGAFDDSLELLNKAIEYISFHKNKAKAA